MWVPVSAERASPDAGGQAVLLDTASHLTNLQEYPSCLAFLEAQPREVLAQTHVIEWALLEILDVIHLLHHHDYRVEAEIGALEPRMMALIKSALCAKSLDVPFVARPSRYLSLRSYASRAILGREPMLDDPGFWPWLDRNYPNVSRLLRTDEAQIKKTSDLVAVLSIMFKSRTAPASIAYMAAVDALCRRVMEICAGRACDYARKAATSFAAAEMEMVVLVAIDGSFGTTRIDPKIPGSGSLADLAFEHEGAEHYVEVYSHADYDMAGTETREDIMPGDEWKARFKKTQIEGLREAGVPSVYVMRLADPQATPAETRSREFRDEARRTMPADSDIVVVLNGEVEAASLRGGRIVETSGLAKRLGRAIWGAMPENSPGVAALGRACPGGWTCRPWFRQAPRLRRRPCCPGHVG